MTVTVFLFDTDVFLNDENCLETVCEMVDPLKMEVSTG